MLAALFENFALQLLFCIGIISVFGLAIWWLNKTALRLIGYKHGKKVFLTTGIIGVPIHEFGHAFFCVIFRHKIREVKWFQPNSADGTLGYVKHSFNKKSIYQQIGNFFIGIGPLLFGSLTIVLLMLILMPNSSQVSMSGGTSIARYWGVLWNTFLVIFNLKNFTHITWWIFIIFACSIAMHMDLSWADIKGMLRGLAYIACLMFVMNLVLCLINTSWARAVTSGCLWLSVSVVSFMAIAVLLLALLVAICALVVVILSGVKRSKRSRRI